MFRAALPPAGRHRAMRPAIPDVPGEACRIDGSRGSDTIAELVSAGVGRSLDAEQVRYLITAKLLPLGVIAAGGSSAASAPERATQMPSSTRCAVAATPG